ncbi:MAG TPA: H-type small acid-soluble spore protein [Bacilli bacterium]|nr:H-type small acid-soluble spore protein [Bacilli bacterium]
MNKHRAKEIMESPTIVNVTYGGVPIYIQSVDEANEMARIYPLDEPNKEQDVPLSNLIEQE